MTDMPQSVMGWRAFGLDGHLLVAPIMPKVGHATDPWTPGLNHAQCAAETPCFQPIGELCTCGWRCVEDLDELLAMMRGDRFRSAAQGAWCAAGGVLARVRLSGTVLPGIDIPNDDPRTTWRGSRAEILEIHLAPEHEAVAGRVKAEYDVDVAVYDPDEWPSEVRAIDPLGPRREVSAEAFLVALSGHTFGLLGASVGAVLNADVEGVEEVRDNLLKLALNAAKALAEESPAPDVARVVFDSGFYPTEQEADRFVELVIEHLYPYEPRTVKRIRMFTQPVSMSESVNRGLKLSMARVNASLRRIG